MPGPLGLFLAGQGISLGASLLGAGQQQNAAEEAARLSARGTELGTAAREKLFREGLGFTQQFRDAATGALPGLEEAAFSLEPSPTFDLAKRFGERSLARGASAAGKLESGQTAESVADLNERLLQEEFSRKFGLITNLANLGAGGAASAAQQANQAGSDVAGIFSQGFNNLAGIAGAQGQQRATDIGILGQLGGLGLNALALNNLAGAGAGVGGAGTGLQLGPPGVGSGGTGLLPQNLPAFGF